MHNLGDWVRSPARSRVITPQTGQLLGDRCGFIDRLSLQAALDQVASFFGVLG
ncbi:hypothetical protein H6F49_23625 [Nodosilinea sp. FACHB-13]|nr:hypothetical protein [Nodosilinea sp. FACHB-13]